MDAIDARQQASIAALDQQLANGKLLWEDYHQRVLQLDLQADAQRRGDQRAQAAHGQHIGVTPNPLEPAFGVGGFIGNRSWSRSAR
jgi:hypothetical protein